MVEWKVCKECKEKYATGDTCEEDQQLCFQLKVEADKEIENRDKWIATIEAALGKAALARLRL